MVQAALVRSRATQPEQAHISCQRERENRRTSLQAVALKRLLHHHRVGGRRLKGVDVRSSSRRGRRKRVEADVGSDIHKARIGLRPQDGKDVKHGSALEASGVRNGVRENSIASLLMEAHGPRLVV